MKGATMQGIADYQFVKSLGRASNGELYLAAPPPRLGLDVATLVVKVVDGPTLEDAFRRATRELRVFASVTDPRLVRLYDAGQEGTAFYYAMEHVAYGSLATPSRPLERREIIAAVADAALAAHALHDAGMAHRDIQPGNILVTETGGKLTDLGLAQVLNPGQTVTGLGNIGDVEYMDPAILRGERASRATDIWAFGATLHRALTGAGIYGDLPAAEPLVAIRRILSSTPELAGSLSAGERQVITRCLESEAAARFATSAELSAACTELLTEATS